MTDAPCERRAAPPATVDRVQQAIALFRSRTASVEERRSAVTTLAGILEERRSLLKPKFLTKDEGALFTIANQFPSGTSEPIGEGTTTAPSSIGHSGGTSAPSADRPAPCSTGVGSTLTY